ncbi:hypothetical protein [Sphingomonas cavernae]|uniref:Mll4938 protein n=1 Tax=Sphingomonas cavernae TaxID=2320861 RepID=A0A418WJY0_9SPHN|nr:hypothetical protein [Sphingomonas cavernae]RJF90347.1 hypothetical protein D3876_08810 [Sphingomonas cavernae]
MQDAVSNHDVFFHVRMLIGVVLGLGLTRILSGIAKIVQHPGKRPLYATHLIWVAAILVMIVHFWWWQFGLARVGPWRFELFGFVLFYAFLFYLLASLLFPEEMDDYTGYEDYFLSRRGWFFGLLIASFAADYFDTLIKGRPHLQALGPEYEARLAIGILLFAAATWTRDRRFHLALPILFLLYYLSWIVRMYDVLG